MFAPPDRPMPQAAETPGAARWENVHDREIDRLLHRRAGAAGTGRVRRSRPAPTPAVDIPAASVKGQQTAVFAGGCFWAVEAVFRHVKGVTRAVSGYAGGMIVKPSYEQVGTGRTGHAESVEVTYDPAQVSYGQLLAVFFSVAHDPTQKDRQGPDYGTQYRSAIFYVN